MFTFTPITLLVFVAVLGTCSAKSTLGGDGSVSDKGVFPTQGGHTIHEHEPVTLPRLGEGRHCRDIWMDESKFVVGELCMHMESNSSVPILVVSYQTHQGWQLEESYLWVGSNLADMPKRQEGDDVVAQSMLDKFPYVHRSLSGQRAHEERIALAEIQYQAAGSEGQTQIFVAAYPLILPASTQSKSIHGSSAKTQNANADNKANTRSGQWWLEFTLNFDMHAKQGAPMVTSMQQSRRLYAFSQRKPNANCFSTPVEREVQASELFTEDFLYRFHVASVLSTKIMRDENLLENIGYYRTIYERFNAYDDGWDDAAIVAKVDNVCYGVFRGTVGDNPADHVQNYILGFKKVPETTCYVREGYYNAYFTDYQPQFEQDMTDCVQSCKDAACELILTGVSQGGAAAIVASMYHHEQYDPIVFVFGTPRVFLPTSPFDDHMPCTHVNKDKQYHFVLADSYLKAYDPVPSYFALWTKNVGREILYDAEGQFNDQGIAETYMSRRDPGNQDVHDTTIYFQSSVSAYEKACLPIPMRGWLDGHWCSDDFTCQQTSYCADDGYCTPRFELGSPCTKNSECLSNACSELSVCTEESEILALDGESCWSNSDCVSGRCEGFYGLSRCQEPLESGQRCNEHSDCLSHHCAGLFFGKCL